MGTKSFKASVQYNDLKGSAAADRADTANAQKWLKDNGLIKDDEFLLGTEMSVGENNNQHKDPVYVTFNIVPLGSYDNVAQMLQKEKGPVKVRRVKQEMSIAEFLGLYKRFNVTLSPPNLGVEGREFTYED